MICWVPYLAACPNTSLFSLSLTWRRGIACQAVKKMNRAKYDGCIISVSKAQVGPGLRQFGRFGRVWWLFETSGLGLLKQKTPVVG